MKLWQKIFLGTLALMVLATSTLTLLFLKNSRDMLWQQDNSVLCVAADSFYDADDYIRDYEAFLRHVGAEDPAKE